jgi:hypothetical protein
MMPKRKTFSFFLNAVCFVVIGLVSVSNLYAASLSLNVQNSRIDIHAEQVPLIDILRTISDEAEIIIETRDPLTELVSLNLKGASIEQCLRRLLGNRNYALTYKKIGDNQIVPTSMRIFGTGSVTLIKPEIKTEPLTPPPEDPLKRIDRKTFEQAFGESNKLAKQIAAHFVSGDPERSGIKLTRVLKNSIFSDIGLKDGDIVQDVNGERVETAEDFIEALQTATEDQTMLRIARIKNNNLMDPIYIELH